MEKTKETNRQGRQEAPIATLGIVHPLDVGGIGSDPQRGQRV